MHRTRRRQTRRHRRTRRHRVGGNSNPKKSTLGKIHSHFSDNRLKYGLGIGALTAYKFAPLISKLDEVVHEEFKRPMKPNSRIRYIRDD